MHTLNLLSDQHVPLPHQFVHSISAITFTLQMRNIVNDKNSASKNLMLCYLYSDETDYF